MPEIQDLVELPDIGTAAGTEAVADVVGGLTPEQVASQLSLLLRSLLDGLPDDAVATVRRALRRGDTAAAARTLTFAVVHCRVPLTDVEHAVLAECVEATDGDLAMLDLVPVTDGGRPILWALAADPPAPPGAGAAADADGEAVLARLEDVPGVLGVWRAWRHPAVPTDWPAARPLYVVEVVDDAAADLVAARFADDAPAGPDAPLVEAYASGDELPPLLGEVQLSGRLLRTAYPGHEFTFCDVFDGEPGPDGRPQAVERVEDDDEARRTLDYLMGGRLLMTADTGADDVLTPGRTGVVPLHLRTDGRWIWSQASAYYLDQHSVAPPHELRSFLAGVDAGPDGPGPHVPDVLVHQAVAWLQQAD